MARARTRPAKSPTRLGDVARLARVSTATVSRAINETGAVSDVTRQKVLRAVQKLHYDPNAHARSLALGRSNQIGHERPFRDAGDGPHLFRGARLHRTRAQVSVLP